MRILVACEFSGVVRSAFRARGHDAWSCDLLPAEDGSPFHIQDDAIVTAYRNDGNFPPNTDWDMMIAHPPCTHLAVSGSRWFKNKSKEQEEALWFVKTLLNCPIPYIALENPISVISTKIRKPDQIVQPYMFGDPYMKTTCLWLKGLPKLVPTDIVEGREQKCWKEPPGADRWKRRSRTYPGLARAMATQWG